MEYYIVGAERIYGSDRHSTFVVTLKERETGRQATADVVLHHPSGPDEELKEIDEGAYRIINVKAGSWDDYHAVQQAIGEQIVEYANSHTAELGLGAS